MMATYEDVNDLLTYFNHIHDQYFAQLRTMSLYLNRAYPQKKVIGPWFRQYAERTYFRILAGLENNALWLQTRLGAPQLRTPTTHRSGISPDTPVALRSPVRSGSINDTVGPRLSSVASAEPRRNGETCNMKFEVVHARDTEHPQKRHNFAKNSRCSRKANFDPQLILLRIQQYMYENIGVQIWQIWQI